MIKRSLSLEYKAVAQSGRRQERASNGRPVFVAHALGNDDVGLLGDNLLKTPNAVECRVHYRQARTLLAHLFIRRSARSSLGLVNPCSLENLQRRPDAPPPASIGSLLCETPSVNSGDDKTVLEQRVIAFKAFDVLKLGFGHGGATLD